MAGHTLIPGFVGIQWEGGPGPVWTPGGAVCQEVQLAPGRTLVHSLPCWSWLNPQHTCERELTLPNSYQHNCYLQMRVSPSPWGPHCVQPEACAELKFNVRTWWPL